jgi:DNA-binding NarL/FixJ family response regulator
MENNMSTELLTQLQSLIAGAEANAGEAELWRETRRLMIEAGYGRAITPAQIVSLVPNVHGINEILAATQEVAPPQPAGSKMPRRKLTLDDELVIRARSENGAQPKQIAQALGVSLKAVVAYIERD